MIAEVRNEKSFTYELKGTSTGENFRVEAFPTVTPGLIITPALVGGYFRAHMFAVTHAASGMKLDPWEYGAPLEVVRLFAGAVGGLPIDWEGDTKSVLMEYGKITDLKIRAWLNTR